MEKIKDKIKKYEICIINLLKAHQEHRNDIQVIVDKENRHYQLVRTISDEQKRYYASLLMHFHLREDGVIYLFENRTEEEVADTLIEQGVSKSDILVGFLPQSARKYAGYALA